MHIKNISEYTNTYINLRNGNEQKYDDYKTQKVFFFSIVYYCFINFLYKTLFVTHFIRYVVKYNVLIE